MPVHHFCTEDASRYGIEEAIVLHNIGFWCTTNLAKRRNIHDGKPWTYNPLKAWLELTPYLCPEKREVYEKEYDSEEDREKAVKREENRRLNKIHRVLKSLEDQGAIVSGNYNKSSYDRTKWYALADNERLKKYAEISPKALEYLTSQKCEMETTTEESTISQKCEMDFSELRNEFHKNVKPIPDSKQQIVNTSSELVKSNAREKNFTDKVFTELSADGLEELPEATIRYARLKVSEYQERFPLSQSVADCWSYVVKALNHRASFQG